MSSSSTYRTSAIAGTLAGLLAVGLGMAYLEQQRAQPAPAPSAGVRPIATAATQAAAVSRQLAAEQLMALPELQAWSEQIEQRSGGKLHGALIEYDPQPRDVGGVPHYQFAFVENGEDATQSWESFLVPTTGGAILVEDGISGELLTLARWRQDKQPLKRQQAQEGS